MNFGIDKLSFYTPRYYLDLKSLADARGEDYTKFYENFGQFKMAVTPPNEDIITMAASCVSDLLSDVDRSKIEMIIFATESSYDLSKSAATYIHKLFDLPRRCRAIELKQACYSATFGLQMALMWLQQNPTKKVLLIAADVARYQIGSAAESSQGSGAMAMLISANPRLLTLDNYAGFCTKETMDFWRPNYLDYALVDGRLSCDAYMRLAEESFKQYILLSGRSFQDHEHFCYHVPLAKLVEKTHQKLARLSKAKLDQAQLNYQIDAGLIYSKEVGNCYTASLYLSILSLLENAGHNLDGKLVGLYSYGSGSVAEFFAARVVNGYSNYLPKRSVRNMLDRREELSFNQYVTMHQFKFDLDNGSMVVPNDWQTGGFSLNQIYNHERIYKIE